MRVLLGLGPTKSSKSSSSSVSSGIVLLPGLAVKSDWVVIESLAAVAESKSDESSSGNLLIRPPVLLPLVDGDDPLVDGDVRPRVDGDVSLEDGDRRPRVDGDVLPGRPRVEGEILLERSRLRFAGVF